jgi:glutaminyl-tRNA synthetase
VYEISRLNVSYTPLSKRKLIKLVMNGFMRGWDDTRMPTIKGLRRLGYTASILNAFCRDIAVTRNANVVQYKRLNAFARNGLHESSPRVMAVLQPVKVEITGRDFSDAAANSISIPHYPFDPSRGSHTVRMESVVYIDKQDFRTEDSDDYFGLAPGKVVGLKYAFRVRCESFETDAAGEVVLLRCVALPDSELPEDKPKGSIQWVPASTAVPVEARIYNPLFTVEEPTDLGWEAELNPESEVVMTGALVDPSLLTWSPAPEMHFQFERLGFFVVDKDSLTLGKLVLNMTVNLKDSKPKGAGGTTGAPNKSRKDEQAKALADKLVGQ